MKRQRFFGLVLPALLAGALAIFLAACDDGTTSGNNTGGSGGSGGNNT